MTDPPPRNGSADEVLYESGRRFVVGRWEPGPLGLLLHSHSPDEGRVDLRFTGVPVVSLPGELDGLLLAVGRGDLPGHVAAVLGRPRLPGEVLYTLRSRSAAGWVLATGVHGLARAPDDDTDLRVEPQSDPPRAIVRHPAR